MTDIWYYVSNWDLFNWTFFTKTLWLKPFLWSGHSQLWPLLSVTEHSGMCWQGCPCSLGIMWTHTGHSGLGMHTMKHVSVGYLPWAGRDTALAVTKSSASDTHTATSRTWMCVWEGGQMIKKLVWAAYKTKRDCDLNLHQAAVVTLNVDIQREWASEQRKPCCTARIRHS